MREAVPGWECFLVLSSNNAVAGDLRSRLYAIDDASWLLFLGVDGCRRVHTVFGELLDTFGVLGWPRKEGLFMREFTSMEAHGRAPSSVAAKYVERQDNASNWCAVLLVLCLAVRLCCRRHPVRGPVYSGWRLAWWCWSKQGDNTPPPLQAKASDQRAAAFACGFACPLSPQ